MLFYILQVFWKSFGWMIIWLWDQIVFLCFHYYKLNISMVSYIFHSFSENRIIYQLEKSFSKSFLTFCLALRLCQCMILAKLFLNLIVLRTCFNINLWFSTCFKFFLYVTCSLLRWKLVANFPTFLIFIVLGKNSKCVNFQDDKHQLQEDILQQYLNCSFLWKFY